MEITAKSKTAIIPQSLPPTEKATYYHFLRVHLQVIQWKTLMTTSADPLEWGWKLHPKFAPIMTDLETAPKESLNFVSWNENYGTNLCSYRKNVLTCVLLW